jgi:HEAT repeat protein
VNETINALEADANVEGLIKIMANQEDTQARKAAAEALGNIGDPTAIEHLIAVLHDKWSEYKGTHDAAVNALAKIGAPAVEPLIAALQSAKRTDNAWADPDLNLRAGSSRALGEIGDPRAIDVLIRTLPDNIPAVRQNAARALGNIGGSAIDRLIELLRSGEPIMRWGGAAGLGASGDPRAVQPLVNTIGDKHELVRIEVISSLGNLGDPSAVEPLKKALKDPRFKRVAASALKKITGEDFE